MPLISVWIPSADLPSSDFPLSEYAVPLFSESNGKKISSQNLIELSIKATLNYIYVKRPQIGRCKRKCGTEKTL